MKPRCWTSLSGDYLCDHFTTKAIVTTSEQIAKSVQQPTFPHSRFGMKDRPHCADIDRPIALFIRPNRSELLGIS